MNKINLLKNSVPYELEYDQTIVFIGANGAGKSRLGAFIEQLKPEDTHRIAAQRALSFSEETPSKSYEKSKKYLFFGDDFHLNPGHIEKNPLSAKEQKRWSQGKYTTGLLNDYDHLLSVLFAEQNLRNEKLAQKIDVNRGNTIDETFKPSSNIEKLIDIWNKLLPHRELKFSDQKIIVTKNGEEYKGTELSDGERVIIYLIGEVLSIDSGFLLIIDEPEIHIHKSIINILWDELERLRDDISIFYITHDLDFARERFGSKKIWVKSFDGKTNWDFEEIDFNDEEQYHKVYFEIMGSRKPVLFVEGEKGSLDYKLYSLIYDDYTVIPVQSCNTVIEMVSSYKKERTLHNIAPVGIVDRDYRNEESIEALKEKGIYTINVHEIENLFCLPEVIAFMYEMLDKVIDIQKSKEEILSTLNEAILKTFEYNFVKLQLSLSYQRIMAQLERFPKPKNDEDLKIKYEEYCAEIDVELFGAEVLYELENIKDEQDINKILLVLDNKGLSAKVSSLFSLTKDKYIGTVFKNLDDTDLKSIFLKYLPEFGNREE